MNGIEAVAVLTLMILKYGAQESRAQGLGCRSLYSRNIRAYLSCWLLCGLYVR